MCLQTNYTIWNKVENQLIFDCTGIYDYLREAIIRRIPNGDILLCTFTTDGWIEPMEANITMSSISRDQGTSWDVPKPLFQNSHKGLFTTEIFCPPDGRLLAFMMLYQKNMWLAMGNTFVSESQDGVKWSTPKSIPGGIDGVNVRQGKVLNSGRWIFPVCWLEFQGPEWSYPSYGQPARDDIVGCEKLPIETVRYGTSEREYYSRRMTWVHNNFIYCTGVIYTDDNGRNWHKTGRITGAVTAKTPFGWVWEPNLVELENNHLAILMRAQFDGWLWKSESFDGGKTWSSAIRTEIPNPSAKFNLLKDDSDKIYLLHNPVPSKGDVMAGRNPLSIWCSDDYMGSWYMKKDLVKAEGNISLNYPDGYIDKESNQLIFGWEDTRRAWCMKISLGEIDNDKSNCEK